MANGNLGSYAVSLPNMFQAPGQALQSATEQVQRQGENLAQIQLRQQEMAEKKAERDEAKMYRKMQTIQELSDLSKYRTTSDVANAIGDKATQGIKEKYIQKARAGINEADLLAEMSREISSVAQGMNAFKTESEIIEKRLADINKDLPNLDYGRAIADYRKEALNRRIDGGQFKNPLEVAPSDFASNLENPDFLSVYARGGKTLTEAIQSPKGLEKISVFSGTPMKNIKYDAQLPFWKRPAFKAEQAPGGFLPKGFIPKLEIKADVLPAEAIKGSAKAPFKIIDETVFNTFTQDPAVNIELIQATRQKFPEYNSFNQVEKNYAKRNVLYDKLSELDQSDFSPSSSTRAPITNINVPKEEKGLEGLNWVKNFTNAVNNKQIDTAIGEARKLFAGAGGKYEFKDLKIAPDGGMSFEYYPTIDGVADKTEVLREKISPSDPNKNYKVANLYQKITGQDVKMERKVLGGEGLSSSTPTTVDTSKFVKGKTYTFKNKNYIWDGKYMIEQ